MSLVHADTLPEDPVHFGTYSIGSLGNQFHGESPTAATSGTYTAAGRVWYVPFYLGSPYRIARWWWLNGATAGTDYIQVGVYDESFNLVLASPKIIPSGANAAQYIAPGIHSVNLLGAVLDTTDLSSYTTASVTLKKGVLYLLSVNNSHGTSASAISSITGDTGVPTFTSRSTTQFNGTLNRVSIWSCVPTSDYTGTLTINFGGVTQTNARWSLDAFYHVDTSTNDGIVQSNTGTGNDTAPTVTLSAFGSADNGTFGAVASPSANLITPGTGFFENVDGASSGTSLETEFRYDNDTTVDGTYGVTTAWGICGLEIKSKGTLADLPAMRGYLAIWGNGTTTTVFRKASWTEVGGIYLQSSQTSGLPPIATPATASGLPTVHVFGFTRRSTP